MSDFLQVKLPVESRESQLEQLQNYMHSIILYEDENEHDRAKIRVRNEAIKDLKEKVKHLTEDLATSVVMEVQNA